MDVSVSTGPATTAAAAPDARTAPKGAHGRASRFGLALLMELGAQGQVPAALAATLTDLGVQAPSDATPGAGKRSGKEADLLGMLAAAEAKGNESTQSDASAPTLEALAAAVASQLQVPTAPAVAAAAAAPSQPAPVAAGLAVAVPMTVTAEGSRTVPQSAASEVHRHAHVMTEPKAELKTDKVAASAVAEVNEEAAPLTALRSEKAPAEDVPAPRPHTRGVEHAVIGEKAPAREDTGSREEPARREEIPTAARAAHHKAAGEHLPGRLDPGVPSETARLEASVAAPPAAASAVSPAQPPLTPPNVPHFTSAHAPPPVTAQVPAPFGNAEWADQFREKVLWVVDRQQQTAELHMNPPHLGPVEVTLTVSEDKTSIAFVSPHAAVREAIEASFSDLRATLEQRGITLGQTSVSADPRDAREQFPAHDPQPFRRMNDGMAIPDEPRAARVHVHRGLVDTFA
jgi:flagellar hook-length control protein FliK